MNPKMTAQYIVHLETLGLIHTSTMHGLLDRSGYEKLRKRAKFFKDSIEKQGFEFDASEGIISITPLGVDFAKVCDFSE